MKMSTIVPASAVLGLALVAAVRSDLVAETGGALTGVVSSAQEGKMEGVVVTARRDGANFDVSVVSDAQGRYSFPRTHVKPGRYALKIRAVGYDLPGPASIDVTVEKTASLDLALQKAKDLSSQITTVEWLM